MQTNDFTAAFFANLNASTVAVVAVRTNDGWGRKQFSSEVEANAFVQKCRWQSKEAHVLRAPVAAPVVVAKVAKPARAEKVARIQPSNAPAVISVNSNIARTDGQVYFINAGSDGRYYRCRFNVEIGNVRIGSTGHCKSWRNAEMKARVVLAKYLLGRA